MTTDPYINTHIGLETETVVIFVALAIIAMGIDMWAHRSDKPIALKQAIAWTLFWISIGLGFAGVLYFILPDICLNRLCLLTICS